MRDVTTGTEYYYLPEEMHSVSALADASGHLVESYRYDVYGKVTMTDSQGQPIEQSTVGNPYFFTGRWLDFYSDSAGQLKQFYDYRARTYDPENGRFLQRDPKGYVDGGNLYEAFGSNPARFVDPLGLAEELAYRAGCAIAFSKRDYDTVVAVEAREPSETELGVGDAIGELPVEFVVGTYTAIRHPIRTGSAIGEAAATTYCNARASGDCRVVAVLQTGAAGAGSVTGLGEIVTAIEEPGTPREKAKHFTKGAVQFVLIVFPLAKAGVVGKAGTVANTLDDVGRAGVNVFDDGVRAGMGTIDNAAGAAGTAPVGTVPPAIGEQLLFDFMREDAALAAPTRVAAPSAGRQLLFSFMQDGPKNPYNISTAGMSAAERQAVIEYARRTNAWLAENGPTRVQSTAGTLRSRASAAARRERLDAARRGTPYSGQVGHVPDTALTGLPDPPAGWLDMLGTGNNVAGGGLSSRIGATVDVITVDGAVP